MTIGSSLRAKIAASFAFLGLLLVILQALATLYINDYQESQIVDQLVSDEMDALIEQYHRHGLLAPPPTETLRTYVVAAGASERELRRWYRATWLTQRYVAETAAGRELLPRELRALQAGFHDVRSGNERFRVEVRSMGGVFFFLAYDVKHHTDRVGQFYLLVAASAAGAALAGAALGLGFVGPLTRQVADLAHRVKHLRHGTSPHALAGHYPDREVAALAQSFDDFQARMASLLERERAFTADVSHELRNPLTAIQTSSELLLQGGDLSPKTRERVEKIARGAARLSELVNALLLLAREETAGKGAEVDLTECLEEAVEQVQERIDTKGLQLLVDVPEDCRVRQPRNALLVVLSNLLVNAVSYTDRGSILLRVRDHVIEVADTGRGIEPGEVPDLFRRFYRGDTGRGEGYGLGLAIVKRICDQSGWRISIERRSEGGSRVLLDLAPDLTKT